MKKYDLEDRLINFSVRIIEIVNQFPPTFAGKHLGGQLLRSGTAPALLYGEAQGAESRADFIHKMRVALKELRETFVNLKINMQANLVKKEVLIPLLTECDELISIFVTSCNTAGAKDRSKKNRNS